MKTSDILIKAAEVMIERGHGKGDFISEDKRVCLLGAVIVARGYEDDLSLAAIDCYLVASPYIVKVIGFDVGEWNDRLETTEAMALGVLHEAALLAKEQGD